MQQRFFDSYKSGYVEQENNKKLIMVKINTLMLQPKR